MPLHVDLKPVERLLFRTEIVAVGSFLCPVTHPLFRDSGPASHHTFVFPRTHTIITHSGGKPVTAGPNCVTLYNQGQEYTRTKISAVDACDWFVVAEDVLFGALGGVRSKPFAESHAPVDARTFIRERMLVERIRSGSASPFDVDAEVMALLDEVRRGPVVPHVTQRLRERVHAAQRFIAASPVRVSLRRLASSTDSSPFHLCRAFRAVTGMSITRYRHELRLRAALDLLRDTSTELSEIALQLGYSSHSHFTATFRRYFGITPSQLRARS